MRQFEMVCFYGTLNTSNPLTNLWGKPSFENFFTVNKGEEKGEGSLEKEEIFVLGTVI